MSLHKTITKKLEESLTPLAIKVIDESDQHAGHSGSRPGGETHFSVVVVSTRFHGLSRVQRHKLLYEILDEEMTNNIHALRICALTPEEN